jgi:chromosome segregation ATPase
MSTNRKGRSYTKEELEQIKQLYAKGYSAGLILDKINRPCTNCMTAATWLHNMQKRLGLPKRGLGFRSIRKRWSSQVPHLKLEIKRLKERKKKLPQILQNVEIHKLKLQKELQEIEGSISSLEERLKQMEGSP